jgi:hypothetical protein
MKNYLQANYDGTIFQYSKDEKPEFKAHTNTKGVVSYRKFYNQGVDGTLLSVVKKNNQFLNNAEEIKITLQDGEDENIISFTVLDQSGDGMDDFSEAMTLLLPKMSKGEVYNINNWSMKKGDIIGGEVVKYPKKGVTLKQEGLKIKSDMTFEYVKNKNTDLEQHFPGDVPMLQWKEVAGKNRPTAASKEVRLIFMYDLLTAQIARINGVAAAPAAAPAVEPTVAPAQEHSAAAGPQKLPF